MTLLRAAARTLLASYFVVSGARAVQNPTPLVPAAKPLVDRFVPMVKQYAPISVADVVPEDAATLVRINGGLQLVGGLALASGKGRRIGAALLAASLIPSTLAKHPFWSREDAADRASDRAHFLKNTSLLGGVLLASADTEGKPSLAWRAQKGSQAIARDTRKVAKDTQEIAGQAIAEGAALVGAVVATSQRTRKRAAKELKRNTRSTKKHAGRARDVAAKAAKQAQRDAAKFAKSAQKQASAQVKAAKKGVEKVTGNIKLGEN